jgi:hypothetical protein
VSVRLAGAAVCCVAATALSSCAGTQDAAAGSAAQDFLSSVQQQDGSAACTLLAPAARSALEDSSGRTCEEAVLEEDVGAPGSPVSTEVYDSAAQVRFDSGTVFLSQFDGTWLVIGAACTPQPGDRPYDCSIEVS